MGLLRGNSGINRAAWSDSGLMELLWSSSGVMGLLWSSSGVNRVSPEQLRYNMAAPKYNVLIVVNFKMSCGHIYCLTRKL